MAPSAYPATLASHPPLTLGELFSRPNRWVKHHNALNREGVVVDQRSPQAVTWCLYGALALVYGPDSGLVEKRQNQLLAYIHAHYEQFAEIGSVSEFNDAEGTSFKDIRRCCLGAGV
jgi:hypothetical protein